MLLVSGSLQVRNEIKIPPHIVFFRLTNPAGESREPVCSELSAQFYLLQKQVQRHREISWGWDTHVNEESTLVSLSSAHSWKRTFCPVFWVDRSQLWAAPPDHTCTQHCSEKRIPIQGFPLRNVHFAVSQNRSPPGNMDISHQQDTGHVSATEVIEKFSLGTVNSSENSNFS